MVNKSDKIKHYQQILNKGVCKSLLQEREEDYKELIDLFQNHPEYPYKLRDLKDICIVRNKRNNKYYEFNLIRDDGTTEDISYRCCINERNINKNLYDAMRDCIDPQIKLFRNNNIMRCEFCDKTEEIHIDHIIMFKDLTNNFLKNKKNIPTDFDDNNYNGAMFRDIDKDFADEWFKYHLENAQLRPLCKCCNLTRTKK
jgi:hypothetical protein